MQNSTQKPLVVGSKKHKISNAFGEVSYIFEQSRESFEELIIVLQKLTKPPDRWLKGMNGW